MKNILLIVLALSSMITVLKAQSDKSATTNTSNLSISSYVSDQINGLPTEAKEILSNKLSQLITQNGITNGSIGTRFILTPNISVMSKDITPTAPPMVALNLDFTMYIGDGIDGRKFSSKTISAKGVGTNETKAYIDAIKNISPRNAELIAFLADGKKKIVDYYHTNCESIIKSSQSAAGLSNYEQAIAQLSSVPEVCQPCYDKSMNAAAPMHKKYIEQQCNVKLTKARAAWNAGQNFQGASTAGELLAAIEPSASCYNEAVLLNKEITKRMTEIGNKEWDYKMKEREGDVELGKARIDAYSKEREGDIELEKTRINAYSDIRMAYYYSQQNVFLYNIYGWW